MLIVLWFMIMLMLDMMYHCCYDYNVIITILIINLYACYACYSFLLLLMCVYSHDFRMVIVLIIINVINTCLLL